jgi:hypothetical protein
MSKKIWIALGLFSVTAAVATAAWQADDAAMMKKMEEAGKPGAAHKVLDAHVGKWDYTIKFSMTPGAPMTETKGTTESAWILDGRFVQEKVKGEFMGQPFHGISTVGYDNVKKKYVWTWTDNMSTGFAIAEGDYDAATKTFTYTTKCSDPMSGGPQEGRSIEKWIDNDTYNTKSYVKGADGGKDVLMMDMTVKRAK